MPGAPPLQRTSAQPAWVLLAEVGCIGAAMQSCDELSRECFSMAQGSALGLTLHPKPRHTCALCGCAKGCGAESAAWSQTCPAETLIWICSFSAWSATSHATSPCRHMRNEQVIIARSIKPSALKLSRQPQAQAHAAFCWSNTPGSSRRRANPALRQRLSMTRVCASVPSGQMQLTWGEACGGCRLCTGW